MAVLVTGGAGFIGSHTCVELLARGYEVVVADDYSNSSPAALDAVRGLAGRPVAACELDLRDHRALGQVFAQHQIEAVIHFAAKKAVSESMRIPIDYFDINIGGTTSLLRAMLTTMSGTSYSRRRAPSTVTSTPRRSSRKTSRAPRTRMPAPS